MKTKKQLIEEIKELRDDLFHTELFNVKLILSNKILNGKKWNKKKRLDFITCMDEAETIKECKEIYVEYRGPDSLDDICTYIDEESEKGFIDSDEVRSKTKRKKEL